MSIVRLKNLAINNSMLVRSNTVIITVFIKIRTSKDYKKNILYYRFSIFFDELCIQFLNTSDKLKKC